jgi:Leucine-rich repeat (LRR) protein
MSGRNSSAGAGSKKTSGSSSNNGGNNSSRLGRGKDVDGLKDDEKLEESHYDMQDILDGMIGEDYLRKVTGTDDLESVTTLKMSVDTSLQSIHAIDELVPNLHTLILDGSAISSLRDLGVGLRNLRVLSLVKCSLSDLDGIGALYGLQELNLSSNTVSEVISLAMHDNIEVRASHCNSGSRF